jgi:hypothetical protein
MKRLACWIGRHGWTPHIEHGEEYEICSRCGKVARHKPTPEEYAEAHGIVDHLIEKVPPSGGA